MAGPAELVLVLVLAGRRAGSSALGVVLGAAVPDPPAVPFLVVVVLAALALLPLPGLVVVAAAVVRRGGRPPLVLLPRGEVLVVEVARGVVEGAAIAEKRKG